MYKNGKTKLLFALAGEIAKKSEKQANMSMVIQVLTEMLKK